MTFLNPTQQQNIKAFVIALSEQTEPLPLSLQNQLKSIGLNLANRVVELDVMAANLPNLNKSYQAAQTDLRTHDQQGEADTSAQSELIANENSDELNEKAVQIFTSPDSVKAAQDYLAQVKHENVSHNVWRRFFRRN